MDELNHAIALYIGWKIHFYPKEDASRVITFFGQEKASKLLLEVDIILEDLDSFKPDWSKHTYDSAAYLAIEQLKSHHPELNQEGLSALEWMYRWWYK